MEDKPDLAAETLAAVRLASRGQSHRRSGSRRRFAVTDPTYTGSGPDSRDPQLVEEGVADLVNERGWQERVRVASIIGRWPEIAGSQLADHVAPVEFKADSKLLVLGADSTAWATQVRILSPDLLRRLDEILGPGVVAELRVEGPRPPRQRFGRWSVAGRGPRDTYG